MELRTSRKGEASTLGKLYLCLFIGWFAAYYLIHQVSLPSCHFAYTLKYKTKLVGQGGATHHAGIQHR